MEGEVAGQAVKSQKVHVYMCAYVRAGVCVCTSVTFTSVKEERFAHILGVCIYVVHVIIWMCSHNQ